MINNVAPADARLRQYSFVGLWLAMTAEKRVPGVLPLLRLI